MMRVINAPSDLFALVEQHKAWLDIFFEAHKKWLIKL
jgi:hypothetical protein